MAIVKKYSAEVVSIQNYIENVYTVRFKSLKGLFKYYPGQFLHLALEEYDPSGGWIDSRCFSMQSPPGNEYLDITYAVKGNYTHRMSQELVVGKEVTLKLPYGDLFIQYHNKDNSVFISGGTGITPFLSLFNSSEFREYYKPYLYAGFRSKLYNVYQNELKMALNINPSFIINYVYQDKNGLIDINKILYESDLDTSFFLSGPPQMIKSFKESLIINNIPKTQIFTDDWE